MGWFSHDSDQAQAYNTVRMFLPLPRMPALAVGTLY